MFIKKNNIWELMQFIKEQKIIDVNSVYKTKLKKSDEVDKYKICLVAERLWAKIQQEYNVYYKKFLLLVPGMIQ